MLKRLLIILAIILLLTSLNINTVSANPDYDSLITELSDVQIGDWYLKNLVFLYNMQVVKGTGEGKFEPDREVTAAEYIKMVVASKYGEQELGKVGSILAPITKPAWYQPYVDKAIKEGIIDKKDFTEAQYKSPISRNDMAKIIIKACKETYGDYNTYSSMIKDFSKIPKEYQEYVLKAYSKGIITGYTDGAFGGANNMKRSESIAVIARLLDHGLRKLPEKPIEDENELKEVPKAGVYSGVSFNPATDLEPNGVFKWDKQIEFMNMVLDHLSFYKGSDGKFYVNYDYPEFPAGFRSGFQIEVVNSNPNGNGVYYMTNNDAIEQVRLPEEGSFTKVLTGMKSVKDIEGIIIRMKVFPKTGLISREVKDQAVCSYVIDYVPSTGYTMIGIIDVHLNKSYGDYDILKMFNF